MKLSSLLVLLMVSVISVQAGTSAGPFGFEAGMTKQQITNKLGHAAIIKQTDEGIILNTAPLPHSRIERYMLVIDPKRGLVKIVASSKAIPTSAYGDELKKAFDEMEKAMVATYGEGNRFDRLRAGSIWDQPHDFMMGFLKNERTLQCFWPQQDSQKLKNRVATIQLKANALDETNGILLLGYEFEGFSEYRAEKKRKENEAL